MKGLDFTRRTFLGVTVPAVTATLSGLKAASRSQGQEAKVPEPELTWHNVEDWGVEGRGWPATEMKRFYDRLPGKAEGVVRDEVWNLSRDSAGMLTRFQTDATTIHVRYHLFRERVAMSHMPATGVSGVDLYAADGRGDWRWVAVARPEAQDVDVKLIEDLDPGPRPYSLYLPLYNGIDRLEIGVPKGSRFEPNLPRSARSLLFYGTSITHGACASRTGMPHPAILGRRLGLPVINLGFSGNGRMESEVGALLAELDPAVYVIDCLPNMTDELVKERAEPLVRQLREARPATPVVLVEDRTYTNAWIQASKRERHEKSRAELRNAFERLTASGVGNLYYLEGPKLLGQDDEATTDGSHPSDLGFMRQADAFEPVLRKALAMV